MLGPGAMCGCGPDSTRVTAVIGYEPEGIVEKAGDKIGIVDRRVQGDLERFKSFIEERGRATGAWRGERSRAALSIENRASNF